MSRLVSVRRALSRTSWQLTSRTFRHEARAKVFCIGMNKTGTTSLEQLFHDLGYQVGSQRRGERIFGTSYLSSEWKPLIRLCRSAEFFQDVPFSAPGTFKICDSYFPGSKFVLTVRSSADVWWNSLVRFHYQLVRSFGAPPRESGIPTIDDVKRVNYVRNGWMLDTMRFVWGTPDEDLYNYERLTSIYLNHNDEVRRHFSARPKDFIEIDLSAPEAWPTFSSFMGLEATRFTGFPHLNRSQA